jgi:hypothetical protein
LTLEVCVDYRVYVCSARDRKGVQSGKRSLFSKTRPSRALPFPTISPNIFLKNKLFLLSPLRSKRATLYIHPHGRVRCFGAAKPGRRDQSRRVFALGPFCHTDTHTTQYSNSDTTHTTPSPLQPYLQGTRPLRSQLLQCTLIRTWYPPPCLPRPSAVYPAVPSSSSL